MGLRKRGGGLGQLADLSGGLSVSDINIVHYDMGAPCDMSTALCDVGVLR